MLVRGLQGVPGLVVISPSESENLFTYCCGLSIQGCSVHGGVKLATGLSLFLLLVVVEVIPLWREESFLVSSVLSSSVSIADDASQESVKKRGCVNAQHVQTEEKKRALKKCEFEVFFLAVKNNLSFRANQKGKKNTNAIGILSVFQDGCSLCHICLTQDTLNGMGFC